MSYLMCLYLYYYGNNLHRFGFVRGQLPDDADMNKGMTYDQVEDYLSEADREFFKGVSFTSHAEANAIDNVKELIQSNRGLVSKEELNKGIGKETQEQPIQRRQLDPYGLKIRQEMEKAMRESEQFNRRVKFTTNVENMDYDDDMGMGEISLDIFDELNN